MLRIVRCICNFFFQKATLDILIFQHDFELPLTIENTFCSSFLFSHPLKSVTCLVWEILSLVSSVRVWYTSFCVQAVIPAMSTKPCTRHFSMRLREHMFNDRSSHIFKHLQNSQQCHLSCSNDCFWNVDHASTVPPSILRWFLRNKSYRWIFFNFPWMFSTKHCFEK